MTPTGQPGNEANLRAISRVSNDGTITSSIGDAVPGWVASRWRLWRRVVRRVHRGERTGSRMGVTRHTVAPLTGGPGNVRRLGRVDEKGTVWATLQAPKLVRIATRGRFGFELPTRQSGP